MFEFPAHIPRPPRRLTVSSVTSSSVELRWYPPTVNVDQLGQYVIRYRQRHAETDFKQVWTRYVGLLRRDTFSHTREQRKSTTTMAEHYNTQFNS